MIAQVRVKQLKVLADERGRLMEIMRADDELFLGFGQVYITTAYPGVVKAWHYHKLQDDLWVCASGMIRAGLYDLREGSPTYRQTQEVYLGEYNPILLRIPVGVAHGYKVVGNQPALLIYFVTTPYNREQPDEYRIPWDSPDIPFDWSLQNH